MAQELGLNSYVYKFFEYFITQNLPQIKSVDLFFNQFETQETGETDARSNPRILIEIPEYEPIQGLGRTQSWVGEVILHIGIDIVNTFSKSKIQNKNLEYLGLLDEIYLNLAYLSTYDYPESERSSVFDIYNIERSRILLMNNPGAIKVSQIAFKFIIDDASNMVIPGDSEILISVEKTITVA